MKIKYSAVDTEKERITMLLQMFKDGLAGVLSQNKEDCLKIAQELHRVGYQYKNRNFGANQDYFNVGGTVHYLVSQNHTDGGIPYKGKVICCTDTITNIIKVAKVSIYFNAKILIDNIVEFENLS